MCGIVAALNMDVTGLLAKIKHRGVRARVSTVKGGSVGHVRLPIVGLGSEYDQPVEVDGWLIAFVGEVLDFQERRPWEKCDLQTVVDSWCKEGPFGLSDRDGFWAVVAYDTLENQIHVLCDYLAQKPMYYRVDLPVVASELVALSDLTSPDEIYLSAVIKWGYCPDVRRTPFNEVKRVMPGEHVVLREKQPPETETVDPLLPYYASADQLKVAIEQAICRRVVSSDVPVACLLSGGLDSSIVYTVAKRLHRGVRVYYASDAQQDLDEELAVSAVAGRDSVRVIKWEDVPLIRALNYMQEPVDLGSLVPQVALSDQIEEDVCLTGDGADEFFGGYGRAMRYDSQGSDVWHELVGWHLPRLDRVMMRNCVEVRSPFLSRTVAGMALALPYEHRRNKKILRDLFRSDLPPGIADREKKPLRTKQVEFDREKNSIQMVDVFRRMHWRV
jgi:asparagine synthase (glutamine-hydrolysing)